MSEKGLEHQSKQPIEVEGVFGQLKSNNKFNRFTFSGLEKVESLLMAVGHNFRSTKVAISSKIVLKAKIKDSKLYIEIKIQLIRPSKVNSLNNSNSNFCLLKLVA